MNSPKLPRGVVRSPSSGDRQRSRGLPGEAPREVRGAATRGDEQVNRVGTTGGAAAVCDEHGRAKGESRSLGKPGKAYGPCAGRRAAARRRGRRYPESREPEDLRERMIRCSAMANRRVEPGRKTGRGARRLMTCATAFSCPGCGVQSSLHIKRGRALSLRVGDRNGVF